eukprot:scaffold1068_cov375-Prasinococcus_capsulatus_cf.AAC.13
MALTAGPLRGRSSTTTPGAGGRAAVGHGPSAHRRDIGSHRGPNGAPGAAFRRRPARPRRVVVGRRFGAWWCGPDLQLARLWLADRAFAAPPSGTTVHPHRSNPPRRRVCKGGARCSVSPLLFSAPRSALVRDEAPPLSCKSPLHTEGALG